MPLIFGAYDLEQDREFNAAMFLGPGGEPEEKRLELGGVPQDACCSR